MSAPPLDPPRHSYRFTAPNTGTTVKVTRDLVGALLVTNGHGELTDTVRLLVSEVVTNVLQHTGAALLTLDATITPEAVTVRVTDREPGRRPVPPRSFPGDAAEGGRGLMLVDCLADRWGVSVNEGFDPVSKSVWFALNGKG
ncbi:ATP-binding protein [Streptomyces uncialis]|uniref:ATP-binding protein n=1 Tax=Streptomyces uncialis TaxID=1048205 RepID=UPI002E33F806|nr:ATP-binding protein [Streptomyces uncialis]